MPPFTYEYKNDIFFIKDSAVPTVLVRAHYPEDGQNKPASVVFGFEYATGKFIPIGCTADGKLDTTATLIGTITIADVTITDKLSALDLTVKKAGDSPAVGAPFDGGIVPLGLALDNTYKPLTLNNVGAVSMDDSAMQKQNMASVFTYTTVGGVQKVQTIKEYPQGAAGGSPAKLTTLSWNPDGTVASSVTTDTTV